MLEGEFIIWSVAASLRYVSKIDPDTDGIGMTSCPDSNERRSLTQIQPMNTRLVVLATLFAALPAGAVNAEPQGCPEIEWRSPTLFGYSLWDVIGTTYHPAPNFHQSR